MAAAQTFPARAHRDLRFDDGRRRLGHDGAARARAGARGAPLDEIVAALDAGATAQHLYACLPDLSHLQRTGRIGAARAALGTLMKIVPVLAVEDGQVVAEAQVRTFARAQETMLDLDSQGRAAGAVGARSS